MLHGRAGSRLPVGAHETPPDQGHDRFRQRFALNREDRRIGADAKRQRDDCRRSKTFVFPQKLETELEILQEFLNSNWTDNRELWKRARDAYTGSIGRWIDAVGDRNVVHSYYDFRDTKIKEMAEEFLQEHDIKPLWRL